MIETYLPFHSPDIYLHLPLDHFKNALRASMRPQISPRHPLRLTLLGDWKLLPKPPWHFVETANTPTHDITHTACIYATPAAVTKLNYRHINCHFHYHFNRGNGVTTCRDYQFGDWGNTKFNIQMPDYFTSLLRKTTIDRILSPHHVTKYFTSFASHQRLQTRPDWDRCPISNQLSFQMPEMPLEPQSLSSSSAWLSHWVFPHANTGNCLDILSYHHILLIWSRHRVMYAYRRMAEPLCAIN